MNDPVTRRSSQLPRAFLVLAAAYFIASLGHFAHNAEFLCEYPSLPGWLTRAKVYASWGAITSVGIAGFFMIAAARRAIGLALVAAYAALGFDGLAHYAVAPMAWHTAGANATILGEVAAAALLLVATLRLMALEFFVPTR